MKSVQPFILNTILSRLGLHSRMHRNLQFILGVICIKTMDTQFTEAWYTSMSNLYCCCSSEWRSGWGSSLIGRRTHFSSKCKGFWSNMQEIVVMCKWSLLCFSFRSLYPQTRNYTIQWKRPRTWNVLGNKSFNHLSNSQVCAVHRFWVICQSVSRNFVEFSMQTRCGPSMWRPVTNGKRLEFTLQWKPIFLAHEIKYMSTMYEHIS